MKIKLAPLVGEKPSAGDARRQLRHEIASYANSYAEADGVVHDPAAIQSIRCLRRALRGLR